jgi:hypothetical protein
MDILVDSLAGKDLESYRFSVDWEDKNQSYIGEIFIINRFFTITG